MRIDDVVDDLAQTLIGLGVPQRRVDAFELAAHRAEANLYAVEFDEACDALTALANKARGA